MKQSKTKQLSKADYEAQAGFRYALRLFLRSSEEAARSVGVTPQQYQALLAIQGYPGREEVTMGELAERLQLRHHSAVELANRMEAERLILRCAVPEDRRVVHLRLTDEGRECLEQAAQSNRDRLRQLKFPLLTLMQNLQEEAEREAQMNPDLYELES